MEFTYQGVAPPQSAQWLAQWKLQNVVSRAAALARQAPFATTGVTFVPLSCEISGAWGPATERFFNADAIDYIKSSITSATTT